MNKETEARAAHLTTVLRAIRNVNQLITHEKSRPHLLQQVCELLTENRGYHHAWIALYDEESDTLTVAAESGLGDGHRFPILSDRLEVGEPPPCLERALDQTGVVVIEDPSTTCAGCPCVTNCSDKGVMTARLAHQDRVYGVLSVSIPIRFADDNEELELFQEVTNDVAFALHDIEIEEQRQRAENRLQEQEEHIRHILESINEGFFALNHDFTVSYFNAAAERLLNRRREEILGHHLFEAFPEAQNSIFEEKYTQAMVNREPLTFETYFGVPPYEDWYEVHVTPYRDGITVYFQVITKRKQAEEQLRFQAMLLNQIRDSIVATDLEGRITYTNKANARMLGKSKEEIIGQMVHTFGENPERGVTQQEIIDQTREQGMWRGQVVNYDRDGVERIMEARTWLIHDENGAPSGMVGISTEITEQVYAERALRESEERYRRLVELSPDLIAVHRGGKFLYINEAGVKLLGALDPDEIVGKSVKEFVSPARKDAAEERMQKLFKERQRSPVYEQTIVRPDGTEREIEVVGIPFPYQDGTMVQIIAHDITERKQTHKALQAAHKQLAATLNALPDLLFEIDREGRVHDFRAPSPEVLDLPLEAFLGQAMHEILPDDVTNVIAEAAETGHHFGATYSLEIKGQTRWFELSIASKNGDRLIVLARDVTERKQAEERIKAALREKDVLLREIHHRVKNNLQVVSALLDLQTDFANDERLHHIVQQSQRRIFAMAYVHEHLYQSPNLIWVEMSDYVRRLVSHVHQSCGACDIAIRVEINDVVLDIDTANACGLIVNELVTNALQHAFPPGEGLSTGNEKTVQVALHDDKTQEELTLTISDHGVGLPADVDWQQPSSLGLQIVQLLTRQLRGKIELETGAGTTFRIRFPAPT